MRLQDWILARNGPFLRWSRRLLVLIGILTLGYVGYSLLEARLFQAAQFREFQQALDRAKLAADGESPAVGVPPPATDSAFSVPGGAPVSATLTDSSLGRIEINAIGLAAMIQEGTDPRTLRRGVGHIPGTALPGQRGNVAITGHRDTFFRPLHRIKENDEITLTTLQGTYTYRVESTQVVNPEDVGVLADSDDAILTLVTCYPFYFVGPAPQRFIVRAQMIPE